MAISVALKTFTFEMQQSEVQIIWTAVLTHDNVYCLKNEEPEMVHSLRVMLASKSGSWICHSWFSDMW